MTDLDLITRTTPDGTVLAVVGDLDFDSTATLRAMVEAIALSPGQTLTLDLAGLDFCDSTGITALIAARNHAQAQEAEIVLTNTPAHTLRVLRYVGLDQILRIQSAPGDTE